MRPFLALVMGLAAATAACGGGGNGNDDGRRPDDGRVVGDGRLAPDAAPAPYCTPQHGTNLRLQLVADGLIRPVMVAAPPADPRLFIVEKVGRIRLVKDGLLQPTPFFTIDVQETGLEQGLLGVAFHPQYAVNGRFFVVYISDSSQAEQFDVHVSEFHADPSSDTADGTPEKQILTLPHGNIDNHNGGSIAFGPDGLLYLSLGDRGGANNFAETAQDPTSRDAKILRLDVDGGTPYAIPPGNPWAAGGGVGEMYAWGLRNPWRMSIDPATGDVWIGDVGEGSYEEIDVVRAGAPGSNFGWAVFEGPMCFTDDPDGDLNCDRPQDYVAPVMAYDRRGTGQCAVMGGVVYRGSCMPDLVGRYFFGDYCSGEVRSFPASTGTIAYADTTDHTTDLDPQQLLYGHLVSFTTDGFNEVYISSMQTGAVYRIEVE
ncbi:MAG: PQQ-dependent sugar dehydrogenase [Kofleriaceae bacterium]|nr:PQQ-dependent sugar dehydrogenase [Myxococcales bacterium]MCB9574077.1 PQQ-dependent sugar dehydrogenase [Kofleriaceae bacterium]